MPPSEQRLARIATAGGDRVKYYAVRAGRIVEVYARNARLARSIAQAEVYAYPEAARAGASWQRDVLAGGIDLAWARAEVTA